jgi:DNA-binding NtrC family response regulator
MKTIIDNKSILIIDDDAAVLRALNKVLTAEGAKVMNAYWAGEAIAQINNSLQQLDLIITDLRMPVLGGQTILDAVGVALPQVPVIVITAFGNPQIRAECLAAGAAAFLEKPLDTPQLLTAIKRVFSPTAQNRRRRPEHRNETRQATDSTWAASQTF